MFGQCLSPNVGGRALTPPTRHRLGRPLPYQQADRPQTHPIPACAFSPTCVGHHRELARLSADYARERGWYLRVTNPFAGCPTLSCDFIGPP